LCFEGYWAHSHRFLEAETLCLAVLLYILPGIFIYILTSFGIQGPSSTQAVRSESEGRIVLDGLAGK